jgi:2-oxo-4-hydroxy-4-carboxy--5-ureidoimidazoline (OHCU) decarboxylase
MAKINLNDAFLTTKVKNDKEIEIATNKNVNRISNTDIQEIHQNLMRVLNIKSESESIYFLIDNFKNLVSKLKQEKKVNEDFKKYKNEVGEKALSKSEWLNQKSKS